MPMLGASPGLRFEEGELMFGDLLTIWLQMVITLGPQYFMDKCCNPAQDL